METNKNKINIEIETNYINEQSLPEDERYVFAYTITIKNDGTEPAQLISRHWVITDAKNNTQEVQGEGVVGEQPYLGPGEHFQYTSGTIIDTPVGSMHGSYRMRSNDGSEYDADIPTFVLAAPHSLH